MRFKKKIRDGCELNAKPLVHVGGDDQRSGNDCAAPNMSENDTERD